MLITPLYFGQGLGNQLANLITTKCIALDNGCEFGVAFPERFKGHFFKNFDFGHIVDMEVPVEGQIPSKMPLGMQYYREKVVTHHSGADISPIDDFMRKIGDNYCIHGIMQDVNYYKHRINEVREWLAVEPLETPEDLCVINIRGGEYRGVAEFNLPVSYFENAIRKMKEINPNMKFQIHTDDKEYAMQMFPEYEIIKDIEINWRSLRYTKYAILSNSSFAIIPIYLNEDVKMVIAPKYFGRFNVSDGYWHTEQNFVDGWTYLDRYGNFSTTK